MRLPLHSRAEVPGRKLRPSVRAQVIALAWFRFRDVRCHAAGSGSIGKTGRTPGYARGPVPCWQIHRRRRYLFRTSSHCTHAPVVLRHASNGLCSYRYPAKWHSYFTASPCEEVLECLQVGARRQRRWLLALTRCRLQTESLAKAHISPIFCLWSTRGRCRRSVLHSWFAEARTFSGRGLIRRRCVRKQRSSI